MAQGVDAIRSALRAGDPERALALVDAQLGASSDDALLDLRDRIVSRAHLLRGRFEHEARVASLRPRAAARQARWLRTLVREGLFDEALALPADAARTVLLDDPEVARHLAAAHVARGSVQAARDLLLSREPTSLVPDEALAHAEVILSAGELPAARRWVDAVARRHPDHAGTAAMRASLSLWAGELEQARVALAALPSDGAPALKIEAALASSRGEAAQALRLARAALEREPADYEAKMLVVDAERRAGRTDVAHRLALEAVNAPGAIRSPAAALAAVLTAREGARVEIREVFENVAEQVGPELAILRAEGAADPAAELFDRLSFNFSGTPTWLAPSGASEPAWRALPVRIWSRAESVATFDLASCLPLEDVLRRFEALRLRRPTSPYPLTHRAELLLWFGRYADAENECRRALALDEETRWAWVGLTGALVMQDRIADALEVAARACRLAPAGPPLLVFRGEASLRAGDVPAGVRDLEGTLAGAPRRTSAWLLLALHGGDLEGTHRRLLERMPVLVRSARRDLGRPADASETSADEKRALFRHVLALARGNRSSRRVTWFPAGGEAHVLDAASLGP